MKKIIIGLIFGLAVLCIIILFLQFQTTGPVNLTVRYGITPYQDSALPVVASKLGWYAEEGLNVELVPVTWGDAITGLAGGAIDVVIYNFNSFQPPYEAASQGNSKPVFYCPLYLFKGQAIMVHSDRGYECFKDAEGETKEQRESRISEIANQLKGKRIGVTKGTELDQIVLAALKTAGLNYDDVDMIHASPEDSLAAFLAGDLDAFAAGLTERVEARRHGGIEILTTADVMKPVVDGIVTSDLFARENPDVMKKLVNIWFKTIQFMEDDLKTNSKYILEYLANAASTRYSPEEYKIAWTFNIFPKDKLEADELFNDPESPYYWKLSWDANNEFLLDEGKSKNPVPYSAYWGEEVFDRLIK